MSAGHKNSLMYCSEVGASGISGIFQDLGLICMYWFKPVLLAVNFYFEWARWLWDLSCCDVDFLSDFLVWLLRNGQ